MAVGHRKDSVERTTSHIAEALSEVRARIAGVCKRVGRDAESVRLIAVSKTWPVAFVRAAYAAGHREFGENYVQELTQKADALTDVPDVRWRFIGHLQRNKAKDVVRVRATIDTVDSSPLAEAIARRADALGSQIEVMIQVNMGKEPQKSGCTPEEAPLVADAVHRFSSLQLVGLMTVPPVAAGTDQTRVYFRNLAAMAHALGLRELSMGMSHDFEVAIEEGATMIRVGSAIFGERASQNKAIGVILKDFF